MEKITKNNILNKNNTTRNIYITIGMLKVGEIDIINEKFNAEIYIKAMWEEKLIEFDRSDHKSNWNVINAFLYS